MRKLFCVLALVFSTTLSWSAIAVVQHKKNSQISSGNTVPVTVTSTTNKLIVVATSRNGSSDSVSSVTDNIGNTYVQATSARGTFATATSDIWYCTNATSGVTTVTVTWGVTAATNRLAEVYEVSGYTTPILDVANHGNAAGSSNVITGASVTTNTTTDFVAAIVLTAGTIDQNPNAGNECTAGGDVIDGTLVSASCSILPATAASHNAAWHDTTATPNETNSIAAFKESPVTKSVASPFVIAP